MIFFIYTKIWNLSCNCIRINGLITCIYKKKLVKLILLCVSLIVTNPVSTVLIPRNKNTSIISHKKKLTNAFVYFVDHISVNSKYIAENIFDYIKIRKHAFLNTFGNGRHWLNCAFFSYIIQVVLTLQSAMHK